MTFLTAAFWTAIYGRARSAVTGPAAASIGVALVALVLVGTVALGLAWLRGDARRDAAVACNARELETQLAQEVSRRLAVEAAHRAASDEILRRRQAQEEAERAAARLEHENGELREDARQRDEAAGRNGSVFRVDDQWLRKRAGAAAPGAASGR
jgi:hypothetical protein